MFLSFNAMQDSKTQIQSSRPAEVRQILEKKPFNLDLTFEWTRGGNNITSSQLVCSSMKYLGCVKV